MADKNNLKVLQGLGLISQMIVMATIAICGGGMRGQTINQLNKNCDAIWKIYDEAKDKAEVRG